MDFSSCEGCSLSKIVSHVGLPAVGNSKSELFIIADRPGYTEENLGVSFSGKLGQFLANMLIKAGLTDETQYYLTYLTKCALPDNKDLKTKKESLTACMPLWLTKEILEYKPKVIIALGNDAMAALSGKSGIVKNRGLIFDIEVEGHKCKMLPTFSPSYLLQDKLEHEDNVVFDIKRAITLLAGNIPCWNDESLSKLDYKTIETEEDFKEFLNDIRQREYNDTKGTSCLREGTKQDIRLDTLPALNPTAVVPDVHRPDIIALACDIECRGKDAYKVFDDEKFPLVSIQFSNKEGKAWFLPIAHEKYVSETNPKGLLFDISPDSFLIKGLKEIFSGDYFIVGHNFKFDSKFILKFLGIRVNLNFDTMLAHGLFEETSNSLKKIAWELTDMGGYEKAQQEYTESLPSEKQYDMFYYPFEQLALYGCADADVTYRIFKILDERLRVDNTMLTVFKLLINASMAFLDIENDGIKVDTNYLTSLGIELDIEAHTLEEEFKKLAFRQIQQLEEDLTVEATGKSGKILKHKPLLFNIASNDHICRLFFDKMGIEPDDKYKSRKTGDYSVGRPYLNSIKKDYPIAEKLLRYRMISKQRSGFVEAYPQFIDPEGKIHPDYRLIKFFNEDSNSDTGTVSGRLSCSNPNLQQVPSRGEGKRIKKLFIPDYDEHWLVEADFSGIEMRVGAMYAQDPAMTKFFNTGKGDFHRWVASQISGKNEEDVTDQERTMAKSCSFGILYGAGPAKIAEQASITERQAVKFIDKYFKLFPGLKKWIQSQKAFAEKNLYVKSLFGRVRKLPNAGSRNDGLRESALRRAINSPIQSDASDLTLHALVRIHKYLRDFPHSDPTKPSRLRGSVHDSILLTVHNDDLAEILDTIKFKILEAPTLTFIKSKHILLHSDIAIGKNWGAKESVEFDETPNS